MNTNDEKVKYFQRADGSKLAYAEYGDPAGKPVLYFHGSPGSRLEGAMFSDLFKRKGLRMIAPDRPGMGRSDFPYKHSWLEHTMDVIALAEHLGIKKFSVIGYSGGGTVAQACAYAFPNRVTQAILMGSWAPVSEDEALFNELAPLDRFFYRLGNTIPALFNIPYAFFPFAVRYMSVKRFLNLLKSSMSDADMEALEDEAFAKLLFDDVRESFTQGVKGPGYDALILCQDWGFKIEEIEAPVHIIHGTEDKAAPYAFAKYMYEKMPNANLYTYPGDGHFAIRNRLEEVFEEIGV